MAKLTMRELVASGKPFNPLGGTQGQGWLYSGGNYTLLSRAMTEHGWPDPRFVTKAQCEAEGWTVGGEVPELKIWAKGAGGWLNVDVVNATLIQGMPSMEAMLIAADGALAAIPSSRVESDLSSNDAKKDKASNGTVINPFTGASGKVFGERNTDILLAAMAAQNWTDGRFMTAKQVEVHGLKLADDPKGVTVNEAKPGGFVKTEVFNAADVIGMPAIDEMYLRLMGSKAQLVQATYALVGIAHDPTHWDIAYLLPSGDTLEATMEENGWIDPRFISAEVVAEMSYEVTNGAVPVLIGNDSYFNAEQIPKYPKLPALKAWQGLFRQHLGLQKEQRKAVDYHMMEQAHESATDSERMDSLPGAVMRLNTENRMVEIVRSNGNSTAFGGKPAIENYAESVGLSEADKKRMFCLDSLGNAMRCSGILDGNVPIAEQGRHIGVILAVKEGVAIQDIGRGALIGHDLSKFRQALTLGETVDIGYSGGLVKVTKGLSQGEPAVGVAVHTR